MGKITLFFKERLTKKMRASIIVIIAILAIKVQTSSWTYAGQSTWSNTYSDCALSAQSPIDIPRTSLTNDYSTVTNIQTDLSSKSSLSILNDGGHTQKVVGAWGTTTWDSKTYTMAQFHTHQPSEHTFDGMRYDMEMHFVHQQGTNTDYLVLTVFFNIGPTASSFLTTCNYGSLSATDDASVAISSSVNVWDVLGSAQGNGEYIYYSGSFTTPPCTEGVTFILFRDFLQMSKAQWDAYVTSLPNVTFSYSGATGNYRTVQSLNSRTITQRFGVLKRSNLMIASVITALFLLFNM